MDSNTKKIFFAKLQKSIDFIMFLFFFNFSKTLTQFDKNNLCQSQAQISIFQKIKLKFVKLKKSFKINVFLAYKIKFIDFENYLLDIIYFCVRDS